MNEEKEKLPLDGVRVIELGHIVLGSSCGMILADMGAEVIKIEKAPDGEDTRRMSGFGVGLFHYFNRNKKSLVLDLKSAEGKAVLSRLIETSDVLLENYGPGAVDRLGFDYEACAAINPRLIYCSLKGFMPGPYEKRPSLDNLVQMMGGLAYMTGPRGQPLRAGASVTDIMGGTFGALGIITALFERTTTGRGRRVQAALFESTAFLVGQHMSGAAVSGTPLPPMPEGENPWAVYDLFRTADDEMVFIGIINDQHWQRFCDALGLDTLAADASLATNDGRVERRQGLIAHLEEVLAGMSKADIVAGCEEARVPFAPVGRPEHLFDDPHLNESGGLVETTLPDGRTTKLPKIPMRMDGHDFDLRNEPPRAGEGSAEFLEAAGFSEDEIRTLVESGTIGGFRP